VVAGLSKESSSNATKTPTYLNSNVVEVLIIPEYLTVVRRKHVSNAHAQILNLGEADCKGTSFTLWFTAVVLLDEDLPSLHQTMRGLSTWIVKEPTSWACLLVLSWWVGDFRNVFVVVLTQDNQNVRALCVKIRKSAFGVFGMTA
jgi:hypothetical protein